MKKKAIVMERERNNMILLAEDGSFIIQKAPIPYPEIGDEVDIIVKKNRFLNISTAFIAVAAVLLITFFLTKLITEHNKVIPATGTVVRYVSIDINPSLELGINVKNIVVSIEALNEDGTVIIQEIKNAIDQPVDVLLERIVNEAVDKGYLAAGKENNILIDVSSDNPQDMEVLKMIELLSEKAAETLNKKNVKSSIGCVKTDLKLRECAREQGMSAGKYALLIKAKEVGININEQDMKTLGIVKAIQNAGGDFDKIISITQEKKESPQKIQSNKSITIEKNNILDKENQLKNNSKNIEINNEQKKNKENAKTNSSPSKPEQTSQVKKNIKENSPNDKIQTETNKEKKKKDKSEVKKHKKEKDNLKDKGKDNKDNKDKKNKK